MSQAFSEIIQEHSFHFQPVEIGDKLSYHVNVADDEGVRWEFRMEENQNAEWELKGEKLPGWISEIEQEIGAIIKSHG